MKTKLLAFALLAVAATARADEPTFETFTHRVAELPVRNYAGRWAILQQAAPLAVRPDQQLALVVLQGDTKYYGHHESEAVGYYQMALGLATEPALRCTTATKLVRVYLAAGNRADAEALATAEAAAHPEDATAYNLKAYLAETAAHDSAAWIAAADFREQERQRWASSGHRWQWTSLASRLHDLKQSGKTDAEINAIALPLLTSGNVTFSPEFGNCVAMVNRALLTRSDLRNYLQILLKTVTATPDGPTTQFRGLVATQLALLPPGNE